MPSTATVTWTGPNPVDVNWGDGSPVATGQTSPGSLTHPYTTAGPHTVTLTDTLTGTTATQTVTCPVCGITGATLTLVAPADPMTWNLGPMTNINGTPLSVNWGDGTAVDSVPSGSSMTHTFSTPGAFTVTVTDPAIPGCSAVVTGGNGDTPEVIETPPTLLLACNPVGTSVATWTASTTPVTVDWGDGSAVETLNASPASHAWLTAGPARTVVLTDPATGLTATATVSCALPPPTLSLACLASPANTVAATFGGPAGSGPFTVDWGDATTVTGQAAGTLNHTYAAASTAARAVTVTDETSGLTVTATVVCTQSVACALQSAKGQAGGTFDVTINVLYTNAPGRRPYIADWGDGTVQTLIGGSLHTYAAPGVYTITLTDPDGICPATPPTWTVTMPTP